MPRKELWKALRHVEYGIPRSLRRAIFSLYKSNKTTVRPIGDRIGWFNAESGVRQGSVISPLFFILLMDRVIKRVEDMELAKNPGAADKLCCMLMLMLTTLES